MKKILGLVIVCFFLILSSLEAQITVEITSPAQQSGPYNYFGVKVTLPEASDRDITVAGYIYDEGSPNTNHPFTVVISTGTAFAETAWNFYQTGPASSAAAHLGSISSAYAGVPITFEVQDNILKFNSTADVNTVLTQLDADYEAYNDNYEAQYPNLTAEQLDDMDEQNGFDEFKSFKDFEKLFAGFSSKRGEIENLETTWLANNFGGTDPDDVDLTFDDSENTIFNGAYSFKVGSDIYQLSSDGMYINGVLNANVGGAEKYFNKKDMGIYSNAVFFTNVSNSSSFAPGCKTNKKDKDNFVFGDRRFRLKVALNSLGFYSSAKGKVVHFKVKNNGNWKRARTEMAVSVGGKVYSNLCNDSFNFSERKPASGWARKKQVKLVRPGWNAVWKTYPNEVGSTFDTPPGLQGLVRLNF